MKRLIIVAVAALFLEGAGVFGAVAEGLRAGLILVAANPLDTVAHVQQRSGVMVQGRWLPERELQDRLEEIARSNGQ